MSSVLRLASAMARVRSGFETTTRPACRPSSSTRAQVFPEASSATASSGPSVAAKAASSSPIRRRPSFLALPVPSTTAAWAKSRPTSSPICAWCPPSIPGHQRGRHDTYGSALEAQPVKSQGAATYTPGLERPLGERPARRWCPTKPLSGRSSLPDRGPGGPIHSRYTRRCMRQMYHPDDLAAMDPLVLMKNLDHARMTSRRLSYILQQQVHLYVPEANQLRDEIDRYDEAERQIEGELA